MAQNTLVEVDLSLGQRIVQELEQESVHIAVAFWAKLEEYGEWRFFLASPEFDKMGLFQAYGRIAGLGHAEQVFNRPVITILDMADPIVTGLQRSIRSDLPTRGLRLGGRAFGARSIEEGILERIA